MERDEKRGHLLGREVQNPKQLLWPKQGPWVERQLLSSNITGGMKSIITLTSLPTLSFCLSLAPPARAPDPNRSQIWRASIDMVIQVSLLRAKWIRESPGREALEGQERIPGTNPRISVHKVVKPEFTSTVLCTFQAAHPFSFHPGYL